MRGITVHQPFAQLLAIGAKRYETRPMATKYRGPIAIHAGLNRKTLEKVMGFKSKTPLNASRGTLLRAVLDAIPDSTEKEFFPFGAIIAIAELAGCVRCEDMWVADRERIFGDWTPGRFGWEIYNVRMLHTPIPCKGQLGLWTVKPGLLEMQS